MSAETLQQEAERPRKCRLCGQLKYDTEWDDELECYVCESCRPYAEESKKALRQY